MANNFVPLNAASLQSARDAAKFRPSSSGPGSGNLLSGSMRAVGGSPSGPVHQCANAPAVTLERDGDKITHIRIECQCGQVYEFECGY